MSILKCPTAEFVGTFWLGLGGCGSVALSATMAGGRFPRGLSYSWLNRE